MRYAIERTAQSLFTIITVITFAFILVRLMPGGPVDYIRAQLAQQGITGAELNIEIEEITGIDPDDPIYIQYVDYLTNVLQGDLGTSVYYSRPVSTIIGDALPWTLFVMSIALTVTFSLAIILGAFMAFYEGNRFDTVGSVVATVSSSVPYYIAAVVLLSILGYRMNLFPTGGNYSRGLEPSLWDPVFIADALTHATLPIVSFVITAFGLIALAMRGNSVRILGEDYLEVARLRGLSERRIGITYVGRNAVLPLYTEFMIAIGYMFGGSIILEEIFSYPGLGYYMFQSISARDQPLMMGAFIVITVAVTIAVYVADLTYGKLDPRAQAGGNEQ